jgi:hypothetical protein
MKWPVMSGEEVFFFGDEEVARMKKSFGRQGKYRESRIAFPA